MPTVADLNAALAVIQQASLDAQGRLAQINQLLAEAQNILDHYKADEQALTDLINQLATPAPTPAQTPTPPVP